MPYRVVVGHDVELSAAVFQQERHWRILARTGAARRRAAAEIRDRIPGPVHRRSIEGRPLARLSFVG
ncbi:hypothetical protein GCM10022379_34850 [Micromonospora maritima]